MKTIKNKQELLGILKRYEHKLSNENLEYLMSLICLEQSVIKGISDHKDIAYTEAFRDIARYNIYNHALSIFPSSGFNLDGRNGLTVTGPGNLMLFNFIIGSTDIGNISIYRVNENPKLRDLEISTLMSKLESLYAEECPYLYGRERIVWEREHQKLIKELESRFTKLDTREYLSIASVRKIELSDMWASKFMEEYGLVSKDFTDEIEEKDKKKDTVVKKTLVSKKPNVTIYEKIRYI